MTADQFGEIERQHIQKLEAAQAVVDATMQSYQKKLADVQAEQAYLRSLLQGK